LLFIGVKMMVSEKIEIPTMISLVVVLGILGTALVFSFVRAKKNGESLQHSNN